VQIKVSGRQTDIPDGSSIQQLRLLKNVADNIAVVLNGDIIESEFWKSTMLNPHDEVDLIQFVAGG
jgi:thiamine biosynthesis protein ThiS|tara:strand:- start:156 stop:353 length:198 start_codon:yes stop_codon:yes gene_type:complete